MRRWSHWLVPRGVCDIAFRTEPRGRVFESLRPDHIIQRGREILSRGPFLFVVVFTLKKRMALGGGAHTPKRDSRL